MKTRVLNQISASSSLSYIPEFDRLADRGWEISSILWSNNVKMLGK